MAREGGLVSENIEGYHITSELSSNAFKPVFLGECISPKSSYQHVIVRLLSARHTLSVQEQQDIIQKIAVLQKLQHPYILPILSVGIYNDKPYLIMEYMASGSLHERLQGRKGNQPLPLEDGFRILAQVGQALHYAHQQKVIHGHLKPQNVLFNIRREALVTDFYRHALQLPDEADKDSQDAAVYQAPEQLGGVTTEKSDQYALACLAYTLLTGHRAFMVPSLHTPDVYYKTKTLITPSRLNPALPPHIEEALLKAMARDPDQRYADIAAFLAALRLPPAVGNRAMRETLVTLAEIMQQKDDPAVPATPPVTLPVKPVINGAMTLRVPDEVADEQNRELSTPAPNVLPVLSELPWEAITLPDAPPTPRIPLRKIDAPLTFADAFSPSEPDAQQKEPDQAASKRSLLIGTGSSLYLQKVAKHLKSRPQQIIAVLICLLTAVIVLATSINLNSLSSTKNLENSSSQQGNVTAGSPVSGGTLSPIVSQPTPTGKTPTQHPTPKSTAVTGPGTGVKVPTPTPIPTAAPTVAPTQAPTAAPPPAQVLVPMASLLNNNAFGNFPGQANFDGNGYSYPSNQFPGSGQVTLQGVPYQFFNNGSGNDNVQAFGQTISFSPGNYRQAWFLMSASWGPVSGTMTIQYTDGSTGTQNITVADWIAAPGVLNANYRFAPRGIANDHVAIYAFSMTLDPARTANALILPRFLSGPSPQGRLHVFALTLLS